MQSKSLTLLTAVLFFSASSLTASQAPSCGGCKYVDGAAKVGGVAALAYFGVKGASCLYKYAWKKAPSTQAQLDALGKRVGTVEGNQNNVLNAVFGSEGREVAAHLKSKHGLVGAVGEMNGAGEADNKKASEFTAAYASALESVRKAADEAAAKKAEEAAKAAAKATAKK